MKQNKVLNLRFQNLMWIFDIIKIYLARILSFIYSLFQKDFPSKGKMSNVVIVGLENAGKTTMLNAIKTGHFQQKEKIKMSDKETVRTSDLCLTAIDLCHQMERRAWSTRYDYQGIVFIIDASDKSSFESAKIELDLILEDNSTKNLPLLILANKVDVAGSATYIDIVNAFNLKDLYSNDQVTKSNETRPVNLVMTSIRQQFGYLSGFKWISHFM